MPREHNASVERIIFWVRMRMGSRARLRQAGNFVLAFSRPRRDNPGLE
jgi:hypothetical protein